MSDISKCKSCGASIIWIKTATGKAHPLDAKTEKKWVFDGGGWITVSAYTSHFGSCPQSKQWSKKKNDPHNANNEGQ